MRTKSLLRTSCAILALAAATRAAAQPAGPTAPQQSREQAGSTGAAAAPNGTSTYNSTTEVIVTAQKRSENIEKVPVAVTAFTSKTRDRLGLETVQDIANFTPGLEYSTVLDRAYLRGVGRQTNNLSADPGLATYADGVYNSSVVAAAGDSLFVDRVEILRGPQGTLYGRNSIGGAINSISRRPTNEFYAEGRLTLGNYDMVNAEAAVSGPLGHGWKARLAAFDNNTGSGYFTQLAPNQDEGGRGFSHYIEAQVQGEVTPQFEIWAKAATFFYNSSYRASNLVGSFEYNPFPPGVLTPTAGYGLTLPGVVTTGPTTRTNPGNQDIRTINTDTPDRAHLSNNYIGELQATYHLPFADLKYTGGYTIYRYDLNLDFDGTNVKSYPFASTTGLPPLIVFPTNIYHYKESKDYYSNELDLSSTGRGKFQWIAGLYQYREDYDQPIDIIQPNQPQIGAPLGAPLNPQRIIYHTDQNMHSTSYAVFGQADYQLTSQLRVTGGVRYTKDEKYGTEQTRLISLGLPTVAGAAMFGSFTPAIDLTPFLVSFAPDPGVDSATTGNSATGNYSRRLHGAFGAVTGTAGLEWTPDTKTLVYVKYSRGYKAGGFNAGQILPTPEALPETINAYEGGLKEVFSRTLQANVALFYYDYNNLQLPLTLIPPAPNPTQTLLFNINRSRSYGAELETTWQATPNLSFLLSYAYLNAEITSDVPRQDASQPFLGFQNVNGQRLPQSPRNKLALNGTYTFHFAPGDLAFSANYIFKDDTYDSIFDRPQYLAPSYSQVDLRILFNDVRNRYTVIAYAKNVTDVNGYDNVTAGYVQSPAAGSPNYNQTANLILPRMFGVELQYRFQ